ncbi:MAG: hypothetical protein IIC39_06965 [Candidatus Marinimicrobia bacterium]|nr:hypothetical protein [Candidatus Neomarinimicrobiota bacterium]
MSTDGTDQSTLEREIVGLEAGVAEITTELSDAQGAAHEALAAELAPWFESEARSLIESEHGVTTGLEPEELAKRKREVLYMIT